MRDRADGDSINAALRDGTHGVEAHAARCLEQKARRTRIAPTHRLGEHGRFHIVEQHHVEHARFSRDQRKQFVELCQRIDLALDEGNRRVRASSARGTANAISQTARSKCADVIVLEQHRIEETDAMKRCTAAASSVFLQRAQAWNRLARIAHLRPSCAHQLNKSRRVRCISREQREKIEDRALVREQRGERTFERGDLGGACKSRAIVRVSDERESSATRDDFRNGKAREYAVLAAHDDGTAAHRRGNRCRAGDVANAAEILRQRTRHRNLGIGARERIKECGQRELVPMDAVRSIHVRAPPSSWRPFLSRDLIRACLNSSPHPVQPNRFWE